MSIVEFVEDRLREERAALGQYPDPAKAGRMIDTVAAIADQVNNQLASYNVTDAKDHPLAAGLLVVAHIWSDHSDFQPAAWFPTMVAGVTGDVR